ncbi:MAG: hypothetical protein C0624_00845 [Desulfuromonas sp.]|nr:MAG: hypothetical protein C0624_00845 [Desulfuromonas sp.]
MFRGDVTRQSVPLVLALSSPGNHALRERLMHALAFSCVQQGGRVLLIERGNLGSSCGRGVLTPAGEELVGFPGTLMRDPVGILYAGLEEATAADIYVALDMVSGVPARFDLVLLNVSGNAPEELFMASLAQRVLILTDATSRSLPLVSGFVESLATRHQQRHFTLAVDADRQQAHNFYRELLNDQALLQVECELLQGVPSALGDDTVSLQAFSQTDEAAAFLDSVQQEPQKLMPRGGLQLFWRSAMFCNVCTLRLCRTLMNAGQVLEVCPVQKF